MHSNHISVEREKEKIKINKRNQKLKLNENKAKKYNKKWEIQMRQFCGNDAKNLMYKILSRKFYHSQAQ